MSAPWLDGRSRRLAKRPTSFTRADVVAERDVVVAALAGAEDAITAGDLVGPLGHTIRVDTIWSHLYAAWKLGQVRRIRRRGEESGWRAIGPRAGGLPREGATR